MTPAGIGALSGALFGFCGLTADKVLPIFSVPLETLLFPGHFLLAHANGFSPFGHMMIDTLAYLGSVLLYGAVGFAIGGLFTSRRNVA